MTKRVKALTPIRYRDGYIELTDGGMFDAGDLVDHLPESYEVVETGLKGWPGEAVVCYTLDGDKHFYIAEFED